MSGEYEGLTAPDGRLIAEALSVLEAFFPGSPWTDEMKRLWIQKLSRLGDSHVLLGVCHRFVDERQSAFSPSFAEIRAEWLKANMALRRQLSEERWRQIGVAQFGELEEARDV